MVSELGGIYIIYTVQELRDSGKLANQENSGSSANPPKKNAVAICIKVKESSCHRVTV